MVDSSSSIFSSLDARFQRRLLALGVVLLVLAAMGWFAVTDSRHLAHDPALAGGGLRGGGDLPSHYRPLV